MQHPVHELSLLAPRAEAERLAAALSDAETPAALSVSLFETREGPWRLTAHYAAAEDSGDALDLLRSSGWTEAANASLVPDEDWVARSQAFLAPVRAGRFLIHGAHDRSRAVGRNAIEIDANRAFGTAHHETTRGCLLLLDAVRRYGKLDRVLDLGCGSGVLAIAAARAGAGFVVASDNDPVAVGIAAANARINGEAARISTIVAQGLAHPALRRPGRFDLVFANILFGPLMSLAPSLSRRIRRKGFLILSGVTREQAGPLAARYRSLGMIATRRLILGDWAALLMQRG
jgi:ribosomal protein L11 methyltransferase